MDKRWVNRDRKWMKKSESGREEERLGVLGGGEVSGCLKERGSKVDEKEREVGEAESG